MKTVTLTQYLRPDGRTRKVEVPLPDDIAEMASKQILSCEQINPLTVALWSRKKEWNEEIEMAELADNFESSNSPDIALIRLIKQVDKLDY